MGVALATCADEFQLVFMSVDGVAEAGGAEGFEDRYLAAAESLRGCMGKLYTYVHLAAFGIADADYVDVGARAL